MPFLLDQLQQGTVDGRVPPCLLLVQYPTKNECAWVTKGPWDLKGDYQLDFKRPSKGYWVLALNDSLRPSTQPQRTWKEGKRGHWDEYLAPEKKDLHWKLALVKNEAHLGHLMDLAAKEADKHVNAYSGFQFIVTGISFSLQATEGQGWLLLKAHYDHLHRETIREHLSKLSRSLG